ncbi:MAG: UDP-3-O-(3-hydroxymyristoyl)glucosamine N-acyltransferase [Bacteroidetes bacterium]|nr:UDP-3-O-(3-hydroxymyristoyl)glucosamine N-acyltransferase [Bacteroidota bacterium]
MQFTAQQIALIVSGTIEGNPDTTVSSFGKIEEATAGQLSFLANPKYNDYLYTTKASLIIVSESLQLQKNITATLIRVKDAYTAFATLLTTYQNLKAQQKKGIETPSHIASTATLGTDVYIGAFAYVGEKVTIGNNTKIFPGVYIAENVRIGNNTTIHAGVKIYEDCVIGNDVIIHAGTVVGSDGFGFAPQPDGSYQKVPQIGNVIIEDQVEIGANTTIDRATMGSTIIKKGVKLDNLIQIAHNVEIGSQTVIAAQTGISGSTKLGQKIMIGGQAGIAGHLTIADGVKIAGGAGVTKNLEGEGKSYAGFPAEDAKQSLKTQVYTRQLPELEKRVKELEKLVSELVQKEPK